MRLVYFCLIYKHERFFFFKISTFEAFTLRYVLLVTLNDNTLKKKKKQKLLEKCVNTHGIDNYTVATKTVCTSKI